MNIIAFNPRMVAKARQAADRLGRLDTFEADLARATIQHNGLASTDIDDEKWRALLGLPPVSITHQTHAQPSQPSVRYDRRLSQPQIAERLAICHSCEHYRDRDRDGNLAASCGKIIDTLGKRGQLMHEDGLPNPNARCPDDPRRWDRMTPKPDKVE